MSAKPRKPKIAELKPVEAVEIPAAVVVEIKPAAIPECPASDPALGMKTPAVVAWWFEHHPAEAAERYAGLTMPEFPQ